MSSGSVFEENQVGPLIRAARGAVGNGASESHIDAYARIALAPWVALAGVLPLGFLFYRRNL